MESETHQKPRQLTSQITSVEQLKELTDEQLSSQLAAHEMEIVRVSGVVDSMHADPNLAKPYRKFIQTLRILKMHKGWIAKEVIDRQAAKKSERIKKSNEDLLQHFKDVVLEALGLEMSERLWVLALQRMAKEAA